MKKYYSLLLLLVFLTSSCTITRQYYDFQHHGTESIRTDSDFKYVARNVMGKSKTTYKIKDWKKRNKQNIAANGLMSEAKSNLPALKDNQTYANMSIDVLTTESGKAAGASGISVEEITLEVVVSADIIEYY